MISIPIIVLTGGPGGGKTTLIEALSGDPAWKGQFAALPEAISLMGGIGISPRVRLFQRVMVHMQWALEDSLSKAIEPGSRPLILCHRGSLDPLAYWLDRGWAEDEFFAYTGTMREDHYRRYAAVIHLVTAADGAESAYRRWPDAHRPESKVEAMRIDRLLQNVWGGHPNYFLINNSGKDWSEKASEACRILSEFK